MSPQTGPLGTKTMKFRILGSLQSLSGPGSLHLCGRLLLSSTFDYVCSFFSFCHWHDLNVVFVSLLQPSVGLCTHLNGCSQRHGLPGSLFPGGGLSEREVPKEEGWASKAPQNTTVVLISHIY